MKSLVMIDSFGFLGFWLSRSSRAGSMPMAMAGSESVSRLINSRCTGWNGTARPNSEVYRTLRMADMLPDSRNLMAFLMLA